MSPNHNTAEARPGSAIAFAAMVEVSSTVS
jgi:hypothetical protein